MDPACHETAAFAAEGAVLQRNTMLGGSKPLHRFMKGQPKSIGIVLVIMGSSFFIQSIPLREVEVYHFRLSVHPGFWLGPMFIACGIVYILAEYNPTKRTVTASLALSIVVLLEALVVAFTSVLPHLLHRYGYTQNDEFGDQVFLLHIVFEVYILTGALILLTMSILAGFSLRSSHTKTQVVMTQSQLSAE